MQIATYLPTALIINNLYLDIHPRWRFAANIHGLWQIWSCGLCNDVNWHFFANFPDWCF